MYTNKKKLQLGAYMVYAKIFQRFKEGGEIAGR